MKLGHKTSDFSPRFRHQPSDLVQARCKKLDQELGGK